MAFQLAQAYVQLEQRGFAEVNREIDQTTSNFKNMAGTATIAANAVSVGIGGALATLAAGMSRGLASIASGMIHAAAEAESAQISFETMLGSASAAKRMLNDLRDFAAKTPLEFVGVRQNAQTLLQYGFTADRIMPTIKMLGDVSGGNAEKMNRLTLAIGQVNQSGRLMGQDLLQMVSAGFNPLNLIAQQTGESMDELRNRMADGKVGVEEVMQAFQAATSEGGMFFKNMQNQSNSIKGLWSNISDDLTRLSESMGDSLVKAFDLKTILASSEKGLSALVGGVRRWKFEIGAVVQGMAGFAVAYGVVNAATALYTVRTQAATAAAVFFQSVLNPAALLKIGISLAAAASTVYLMNQEFKSLTESVKESQVATQQASDTVKEFYANWKWTEKIQLKGLGKFETPDLNEMSKMMNAAVGLAKGLHFEGPGKVSPKFLFEDIDNLVKGSGLLKLEKGLTETEQKIARIRKMMQVNDWLKVAAGPSWNNDAHSKMKAVLDAQLGELTGFTKRMQMAQRELKKIQLGDMQSELEGLKDSGWSDAEIKQLESVLKHIEDVKKATAAEGVGTSFLSNLRRDVEALQQGLSPVEQQIEKLKDQGVGEGKLAQIRRLLELQEKLQKDLQAGEKRKTIFEQIAHDLDKATGKVDEIDEKLRELAKAGATEDELKKAGEMLLATKAANDAKHNKKPKDEQAGRTEFIGASELNKAIQVAIGDRSEEDQIIELEGRQVDLLTRIKEAIESTKPKEEKPAGTDKEMPGQSVASKNPLKSMSGPLDGTMKGIAGMLNGVMGPDTKRQTELAGKQVDQLSKLVDIGDKQLEVLQTLPTSSAASYA